MNSAYRIRVWRIYQLYLAGNDPTKIARMLTEQQIYTPKTLKYHKTDKHPPLPPWL